MSNFIRTAIFKKIIKQLQNIDNACQYKIMSNLHIIFNKEIDTYTFVLPLKSKDYNLTNKVKDITDNDLKGDFDNITVQDNAIHFNVLRDKYIKQILESNLSGVRPPLVDINKNIIVEFSSPNIAKPFHIGHLRSTIIGNCIANLNSFFQNQVTKINYLGDWGTQFGYVYIGMKMANIDNIEMQTDPIKTLYTAYVNANKLAKDDPSINESAKEIFRQLELEDNEVYKNWESIKQFTVLELERTYKRIGVTFDRYDWESMYTAKKINKIIDKMGEMQLLKLDNENRKVMPLSEEKSIPIIKSDGTSLYISRDIAAAIDRFERNKFDAMYYIVENGQTDHFTNLIQILNKMNLPWVDRLKHVKFGRVHGMSTRQGTVVFLEDILNKAKETMKQKQLDAKTTKIPLDKIDETSEILGVSGVIIQDLKQSRMNSYKFDWNLMLDMKGDSGIKLQYAHCRLCSLEELSSATLVTECDSSLLKEAEVDQLILLISQFDEVVLKSYEELEPCVLTIYLFHLCKAINIAWRKLSVKHQSNDLGNQRLLLFHIARITLAQGMKLLGLTPLEKM
ncbi:probable arginine--tRNA ligase, mitochondrial isoform X1 [Bombus terrestris]|uniref:Probable arginine--tRNA ligase, mitochondrial n=1 Tax=Bombus terrestris TaxID=30195 RepID=A0A9B2JUU5_BOMTE|nr:probable arginine--tRNA ligase, mitochondrial isoform X1 [Bombus terrestris]XP_048266094.1 probable arginine--tRNA ligase, mitochondrial isoform X1 [Bombus terrestris]XP_048266096.1 probable arginine--tRNA ligase, mitochondrial isoform X1 [Bombus terrestris]